MESIELSGKSIDEIRAQAAAHFGVAPEEVEVEVIEEKRALLGLLGAKELRARATVAEAPAEEEPEAPAPTAEPPAEEPAVEEEPAGGRDDQLARLANRAEQVTNEILRLMGVSVTAHAREISEEEVRLELLGDDIALVIGKHGDTLDALQLLAAIIANRGSEVTARVVLDAEQYRDRRHRALESAAYSHAAKAKQTGREVVIRDLKAFERRVIHLALRDDPEVETYSEGEGRHRSLVISPASGRRSLAAAEEDAEEWTEPEDE
ncbi:MAG: KH domain-containing protein [Armatimonadetes bacterium]|nr:KH domain-containing protein [Armatimonadota bacterium]